MGNHWVYGLLTKKKIRNSGRIDFAIATDDYSLANTIPINENTIGQFTGLKDIESEEIYEGDILQNDYYDDDIYSVVMIGDCWCGLIPGGNPDNEQDSNPLGWILDHGVFNIVGNVHDNPKLLEGGKADD